MACTTTGNTTSIDDDPRVVVGREGNDTSHSYYQIGELTLRDESEGVFTPGAYQRHVVSAQADALVEYMLTGAHA